MAEAPFSPSFIDELPRAGAALAFARELHRGQRRESDEAPFILHPLEVAALLHTTGHGEAVVVAGILHDTVEDAEASVEEIDARFGGEVSRLVAALTEDSTIEPFSERKAALRAQIALGSPDATSVSAADKVTKVRELRAQLAASTARGEHRPAGATPRAGAARSLPRNPADAGGDHAGAPSRPAAAIRARGPPRAAAANAIAREPFRLALTCPAPVTDLRVAIVGYGLAGRFFHAPLIAAVDGLELAAVVSSSPERREQVLAEHPKAEVVAHLDELWTQAPQLVVVAAPNSSHVEIADAAIDHGVPAIVDKPLAVTAAAAGGLADRAASAGVMLTVFQNRRWDTDQLTLRRLIAEGALGEINRYESRFERWRPELDQTKWREAEPPGEGGGVLLDLGSHLVDQALTLFGPATHVYGEVDSRRGAAGDDDAFIALRHANGTISHLHASAVTPSPGPRLRVQGTTAGFLVSSLDPQEAALREGLRPDRAEGWGRPPEWERGRLVAGEQSVPVPPEPGNWPRFYELVRDALRSGGPPPVDPRDAVATLRVLEAARLASRERRVIVI